jgi:acetylglutamate synthase
MVEGEGGRFFWRSRSSNRVNGWYSAQADGSYKVRPNVEGQLPTTGEWTVFWKGLADDEVMPCVRTALLFPPTFKLPGRSLNSNPVPPPAPAAK